MVGQSARLAAAARVTREVTAAEGRAVRAVQSSVELHAVPHRDHMVELREELTERLHGFDLAADPGAGQDRRRWQRQRAPHGGRRCRPAAGRW